ncbi:MAG: isoleucyl-tRNA synthetase, partial [Patescibacteria group bacterium]|nr:isoleucyl-tRNA synthetase [Patescibacteria group bacterium]
DFSKGEGEMSVKFDTELTQELIDEGKARDIVRSIQEERKKLSLKPSDRVNVTLPEWPKEFEETIKKKALIETLSIGKELTVTYIS